MWWRWLRLCGCHTVSVRLMRSRIEVSLRQQAGPGCLARRTDIYHCLLFGEKESFDWCGFFFFFFFKPVPDIFMLRLPLARFFLGPVFHICKQFLTVSLFHALCKFSKKKKSASWPHDTHIHSITFFAVVVYRIFSNNFARKYFVIYINNSINNEGIFT